MNAALERVGGEAGGEEHGRALPAANAVVAIDDDLAAPVRVELVEPVLELVERDEVGARQRDVGS